MKKALTLIELVVAIGIIVLLTAFTLPMLHGVRIRNNLKNTALEIQSSILEAKNYSLAPRTQGVNIQSYAIVFHGRNGHPVGNSYEITECVIPVGATDCVDQPVWGQSKKLPSEVTFDDFGWAPLGKRDNIAEIRFSVEKQGAITTDFGDSPAQIIIKQEGQQTKWITSVIQATGAVSVKERQQ